MLLAPMPAAAAWTHTGARSGFEVLFSDALRSGHRLRGWTTAREGPSFWSVGYELELDATWRTRRARVTSSTPASASARSVTLERTDGGLWSVDGAPRPDLDGCVDVDLESSAATNTLPVHRLSFAPGQPVDVPAVFVRAEDLGVQRLEQRYTLTGSSEGPLTFHYESSTFDVECELALDRAGLTVTYPGIAVRES